MKRLTPYAIQIDQICFEISQSIAQIKLRKRMKEKENKK